MFQLQIFHNTSREKIKMTTIKQAKSYHTWSSGRQGPNASISNLSASTVVLKSCRETLESLS